MAVTLCIFLTDKCSGLDLFIRCRAARTISRSRYSNATATLCTQTFSALIQNLSSNFDISFILLIYSRFSHQSCTFSTYLRWKNIVGGTLFRGCSRRWLILDCHFNFFIIFGSLRYLLQVFICILNICLVSIFLGAFGQVVASARLLLILRNCVDFLEAMLGFWLDIL